MKTAKINDTIADVLKGKLTDKEYDVIKSYSKYVLYGYTFTLPKLLTVDDIIATAITNLYLKRDNFNFEVSKPITWYTTILVNEIKQINHKYNNTTRRIPENKFVSNVVSTEHGESSIFNILDTHDDFDLFDVLSDSKDISEQMREFILENNLEALKLMYYTQPYNHIIPGRKTEVSHKEANMTYAKGATILGVTPDIFKRMVFNEKQKVTKHFTNSNKYDVYYEKKNKKKREAKL